MKMMTFGSYCITSLFLMLFSGCSLIKFNDLNASKNIFDLEDVEPKPAITYKVLSIKF